VPAPVGRPLPSRARGKPGDWLGADRSWAHTAVLSLASSRAVGSSSTRSMQGPDERGLSLSLSRNPSARTAGEDDQPVACGHVCFQPDVHNGHDDDPELSGGAKQRLVPDGTWPAASHLWACAPLEKAFLVMPTRGTVSSFLFSIFLCVQAALKRTVKANITVLNILCDSTPPWTQRPSPSGPQNLQESPSPPSCLAFPFSVLFS